MSKSVRAKHAHRFSSIQPNKLDPEKAYVLFIGDSKYIGTTPLLTKRLSQEYGGKDVEIINILPNMPPPYMSDKNIVVVNSAMASLDHIICPRGCFMPVDQEDINRDVSECPETLRLVEQLLDHQGSVYINLFKHNPTLTLTEMSPDIHVIGPHSKLFDHFDDKTVQRRMVEDLGIPVPEGYIAKDFDELVEIYRSRFDNDTHRGSAFVACANGFGGNGTTSVESLDDLMRSPKLKARRNKDGFIISQKLDLVSSPCTLAIAANPEEVLTVSVADQIMDGVDYGGTVYPSAEGEELVKKMIEYTNRIGAEMSRRGYDIAGQEYRGFFGVDYMVDRQGNLYFVEINPRKIGSTPETILAHRTMFPERISLPELEFLAVTQGSFGTDVRDYTLPDMTWGVRGVKAKAGYRTANYVGREVPEEEVFRDGGLTVLDHPGHFTYLADGRVARAVAAAHHDGNYNPRDDVIEKLRQATGKIKIEKETRRLMAA